jgi:predicted DNA-binding WGR domain protein
MEANTTLERELVLAGAPKEKHWHGRVDGQTLIQRTWTDGGKPRETVRSFADEEKARTEFSKLERKRMTDGYVFRRAAEEAGTGEAVLKMYGPVLHDLSLDGRTLAIAWYGTGAVRCRVILIDVATGARRVVHEEPTGSHSPYLHTAIFDQTGEGLFCQMYSDTWRLDLGSGAREKLASYREYRTANFNAYVARPSQDAARRRLVVFDEGDIVRVLEGGRAVLEVSTASRTVECRAGGISPSGRLLALYRVSRGIVYSHKDALDDTTNEVEVWDIDQGKLRQKLPFPGQLSRVGFDPKDRHLIVTHGYASGPAAYELSSGKEVWRFGGTGETDHSAHCFSWAFSPDGSRLAVGREALCLYELAGLKPVPVPGQTGGYRVERVVFSGDGQLLAATDFGIVVVRKVL